MNSILTQQYGARSKAGNNILANFRNVRFPQFSTACARSPHRYVYWSDGPDGGVGVSFVDPYLAEHEDPEQGLVNHYGFYHRLSPEYCQWEKNEMHVVTIACMSDSELGKDLSVEHVKPFSGLEEHWRRTQDENGKPFDDILFSWSKTHEVWEEDDYDEIDKYGNCTLVMGSRKHVVTDFVVYNDYTNRSFNYMYIRRLIENDKLLEAIDSECFFTDGVRVSRRTGYLSPAYAVALYKSLKRHGLLTAAMKDFRSFVRYHPIDPIVTMSEIAGEKRFAGIKLVDGGEYVVRADANGEGDVDTLEEGDEEMLEEDALEREDPYYVDDCPVYGADDEEDAEMLYWNTH